MADAPSDAPTRGRADLTHGPIGSTLLMFSLPVLGANIVQSLSGSINAVWVGHFLGEQALTATSNANVVLFFLLGLVFGIGMASTILIGQAIGASDTDRARRVVGTTATFFVVASVGLGLIGYLATPTVLHLMGTPADAQPLAIDYLRILFCAIPFLYLVTFIGMVLRGSGDSRTPFVFMVISAALDAGFNPLLIRGYGPFPQMGIAGAAASTLISQAVTLVAMLGWIYARGYELRLHGPSLAYLRPDPELLKTSIVKGLPMGLQMIVISGSEIVMMRLVNGFGSETTAGYGVAVQLWTYVQMPALAVGAAVSSMVAQNVGARQWDRVDRTARAGVLLNLVMTGLMVALLYATNHLALGMFLPADSPSIAVAARINQIVTWTFIPFGVTIVLFGVVRATGAVTAPLVILFISMVIVRIPFAKAMVPHWGADAIWWSFAVGSFVALLLAGLYYRFGGWRAARMMSSEPPAPVAPAAHVGPTSVTGAMPAPEAAVPEATASGQN